MKITRISPFTRKEHTLDIPVTQEQLDDWKNGNHIQYAMPNLSPEHREFIISGITPTEWDEMFKPYN